MQIYRGTIHNFCSVTHVIAPLNREKLMLTYLGSIWVNAIIIIKDFSSLDSSYTHTHTTPNVYNFLQIPIFSCCAACAMEINARLPSTIGGAQILNYAVFRIKLPC